MSNNHVTAVIKVSVIADPTKAAMYQVLADGPSYQETVEDLFLLINQLNGLSDVVVSEDQLKRVAKFKGHRSEELAIDVFEYKGTCYYSELDD